LKASGWLAAVVLLCACEREPVPATPADHLRTVAEATIATGNFEADVSFFGTVVWTIQVESDARLSGFYHPKNLRMTILTLDGETYVSVLEPEGTYCSLDEGAALLTDPSTWVEQIASSLKDVEPRQGGFTFTATLEGFNGPVSGTADVDGGLLSSVELREPGSEEAAPSLALAFSRYGSVPTLRPPPPEAVLAPDSSTCRSLRELLQVYGLGPSVPPEV
jgi:hypothetical protein